MRILLFSTLLVILFSCKKNPEFTLGQKVNPNLYTVNTGTSFYWCHPDNLTTCIDDGKDFMPAIIRFPGGLDANFYHMDGKGYGYRRPPTGESDDVINGSPDEEKTSSISSDDDVEARYGISDDQSGSRNGSDDPSPNRSSDNPVVCREIKKAYHFDNKKRKTFIDPRDKAYPKNENVISNVLNYCKRTSSKILFTCNMVDASYGENKKVIETILAAGVEVVGIELGNEIYLKDFQCLKYDSPAIYIDTAKMYTANLRKDFPNIKIGIVAAPSEVIGINPKRLKYYQSWNDAIKKETFYDGYVVHHYMKDKSCDCKNGFSTSDSVKMKMECHQSSLNKELEMWFGNTGINAYKSMFPGKKMWLTEWNSTNVFRCFGNTQASNLFYTAYQNELVKYGNEIEFATFHNWLGNGEHFPIIRPKGKSFEKRSSSLVFSSLLPLFSQRENFELKIPPQLTSDLPKTLKVYAYHQPKTVDQKANITIVIVNPTSEDHTQKIYANDITINGEAHQLNKGKYIMSYSKSLAASLGKPGFGDAVENIKTDTGQINNQIQLKGYSFTIINYELD